MSKRLAVTAPTVSPEEVLIAGAAALRTAFSPDVLPGILLAYMWGIKVALATALAGAGLAFFVALAEPWKRLNPEKIQGGA